VRFWVLFAASINAGAHTVSMSTGDLRVTGTRAEYELRIPMYEVEHARDRELPKYVEFGGARVLGSSCANNDGTYVCKTRLEFSQPVEELNVRCTLARATVPNHVHLLRAYKGDRVDQAGFDSGFEEATLRFRDLSPLEKAVRALAPRLQDSGLALTLLLIVAALAAVGRPSREAFLLAGYFVLACVAGAVLSSVVPWRFSPRFLESTVALAAAYVAVEILFLDEAGGKWIAPAILGVFTGIYFEAVTRDAGPASIIAGCTAALLVGVAAPLWKLTGLKRALAGISLVGGVSWFTWSLL
jgi:hypothetical protein